MGPGGGRIAAGVGGGRNGDPPGPPPEGGDDLAGRVVDGDPRAWRTMVETYRPLIARVLLRATGDREVVLDLEQDLWTRLLGGRRQALHALRGRGAAELRAYLCTVALNLARDHARRQEVRRRAGVSALVEGESLDVPGPDDPEDNAAASEQRAQIFESARELSGETAERDVMIFRAYYEDGYTSAEIASMGVGIGPKGVEAVLHRLTVRMRAHFGPGREA